MKTFFIGFFTAFLFTTLNAQKPPVKFGDVTKEELSMTSYDKDSSAAAVILADFGQSSVTYRQNIGFTLDFERITRIKILTKDGLDWGNFTIPLFKRNADDEKLSALKAVTYNLEGGKIVESRLKNDGIFREQYDANWDFVKVTCPNVREGSIVEITYNVNSPFLMNFQDWQFQNTIPTVLSEYRAQIPEYYNYDKYMQGYVPLDVIDETSAQNSIRLTSFERDNSRFATTGSRAVSDQIDYTDRKYRWAANNVPAFKPEPYMASINDYVTKMNFELSYIKYPNEPVKPIMGSWADINKTLQESENFGGELKGNGFLKKVAEEVTAGITSAEEKIAAIANFIKQNVVWDGTQRMFPAPGSSLKKVFEDKKGNSAEINLLLASLLEKAALDVYPVALSTRNHGMLRKTIPVSSQFNYTICLVKANGKSFLLDATEKLLPLGMLPERCLNGEGFAVSKEGFQWIPLESKYKTRTVTAVDLTLNQTGELEGKLKQDCNGYVALNKRKKFLTDGEIEFLKDFVGSHAWDVRSTSITNAKEINNNFTQEHELVVSENMVVAGDMVYVDPFIHTSQKENPFKSEKREYPVDFGSPMEQTFFFKLTLPDNFSIDELPQSKVITMPENAARYIYNIAQNGKEITITSMFHINKSLFNQLEYPSLREFYNQMVAKQTEQIVLKRK
ncbi:MAG: DUF3857 domain-containing protein [Chryseosolibacter sp.]